MDKILESFPLGFLIRSVFSGVFFVLTFHFVAPKCHGIDSDNIFTKGLAFSLVAGVTMYGLHRSLVYPWIEWAFNMPWAVGLRAKGKTLITDDSIRHLAKIWDSKSEKLGDLRFQRGKQIATWADYTHLQYVSAWCILSGTFLGSLINIFYGSFHPFCHLILCLFFVWLARIFILAAVVSNWRLFSVLQRMEIVVPIYH